MTAGSTDDGGVQVSPYDRQARANREAVQIIRGHERRISRLEEDREPEGGVVQFRQVAETATATDTVSALADQYALRFRGVNTIDRIQAGYDMGDPQQFTVAMWLRPDELNVDPSVTQHRHLAHSGTAFLRLLQDGRLHFRGPSPDTTSFAAPSTSAFAVGEVGHAAFTYDQATRRIYKNATEVASNALAGYLIDFGNWQFGGSGGVNTTFGGALDEIAVWNRALSQPEIQQHMDGEPVDDGLISEWRFDEGVHPPVDSVRNATGTVQGEPEWVPPLVRMQRQRWGDQNWNFGEWA